MRFGQAKLGLDLGSSKFRYCPSELKNDAQFQNGQK